MAIIGPKDQPYRPPKKKKKKKPVGEQGLPSGSRNPAAPTLTPAKSHPTPAPSIPQKTAAPKAPPKTYNELLSIAKPPAESDQEQSLANIINPYYSQQKAFPDPITTLQLLLDKGTMPQDPEENKGLYDELWSPTSDATDEEKPALRAGDMFYMDRGDLTDGERKGVVELDGVKGGGVASAPAPAGSRAMGNRGTLASPFAAQPTLESVQLAKQYQRDTKDPWRVTGSDFVGPIIPDEEIVKFKKEMAKRLAQRGVKIKYDPNSSEWEPEWEKIQNKYVFAGQWAYQVYGDYSQTAKANDVMASVRNIAFNKDRVERAAHRLGLDTTQWAQSDTVKSTLEAMRYADDDTVKTFSYDEWQFSRPIGMSETERRAQYVKEFDAERLPAKQREVYEEETDTAMESIGKAFGTLLWPAKQVLKVPGVGTVLKEMGKDVGEASGYIYGPFNEALKGLATAQVALDYATQGYWQSEVKARGLASGGKAKMEKDQPFNWQALMDADTWKKAREEAGGDNLFHIAFENASYGETGKMPAYLKDASDIANLALQVYVGSTLDPLVVSGAQAGAHGAFVATRAGFRMGSAYIIDWAAFGKLAGSEAGFLDLSHPSGVPFENAGMPAGGNAGKAIREAKATEDAAGKLHRPTPTPPEVRTLEQTSALVRERTALEQKAGEKVDMAEKIYGKDSKEHADALRERNKIANETISMNVRTIMPDSLNHLLHLEKVVAGGGKIDSGLIDDLEKAVGKKKPAANWGKRVAKLREDATGKPREFFPGAVDAGRGRLHLSHPEAPGDPALVKVAKDVNGKPRVQPLDRDEFKALDPRDAPPRKPSPPDTPENFMDDFLSFRNVPNETGKPLTAGYLENDVRLAMKAEGPKVVVKNLETPLESRGQGFGGSVIDDLVSAADNSGITLRLEAVPFGAEKMAKDTLKDVYAKRGFKEVGNDWMERKPLDVGRVEGDFDAYNSYVARADEVLHKHISDPTSPFLPHGIDGESATMYSLGGGLVESVTRTVKGLVKKREVHTYAPPAFLRTNAELFAKIEDPFVVNRLLKAPEDIPEIQDLVKQVAASKSHIEVEGLLRKLEIKGVEIDGGKSAMIKQLRYSLGERGFGQLGWARIFNTMTMYGKTSDIATAAEDTFQVGKAIRMGATTRAGRKAALRQLQDFSRRVYEAHPGGKQKIVDEMWKTFENNLGDKLDDFKAYNRHILWTRGQRYVDEILGHSYLPKYAIDKKTGERTLVEGSLVLPSDLERSLDEVSQGALRKWDELWAGKETQLGDEVDQLEQGYYAKHVVKPGEPAPTTGKTSAWKDNQRTHLRSDGTGYTETRKYNPKTKKYELTGRDQTRYAHTGVKTGKGKKGGAALTNKRRELAQLNRQRDQLITNPAIAQARIDMAKLSTELGASPADIGKMSDAVFEATAKVTRRTEAAKIVQELGQKKRLSPSEEIKYDTAVNELSDMRTAQPFKQGQIRTHIYHQYDPRIAGWYMSGKAPRDFMLADQLVAEPVMRMFKETVMASLAFPIRVNIGDEIARFVPEGVVSRMWTVRKLRKDLDGEPMFLPAGKPDWILRKTGLRRGVKEVKLDGTDFTEFELKLRDGMARDWDMANTSGEWHALTPTEPGYYAALRDDLSSWAREPIVKRLVASKNFGGKGKFPTNPKDLKGFIRRIRDERVKNPKTGKMEYTQDATDMRNFLNDTYRSIKGKGAGPGTYNTPEFEEWCNNWYDRAKLFSDHEPMRKAMEGAAPTVQELEAWGSGPGKPFLYPVNAPIRNGLAEGVKIGLRNPLYGASALNPYHYVFKYGSSKLMQGIGEWTKRQLFNDKYYTVRNKLIERNKLARAAGEIETSPEEMHRIAGETAVKYAHQTAYSNSTTMFEDMSRNMVPFISAYRQFFVYWAGAVAKHPLALAAFQKNYPEFLRDPFGFTSGDSQFITPQIPFWAPDSETGAGFWDQVAAQSPSAGLIPLIGIRAGISALGEDPKDYANFPLLKGLGNTMSPFQRIARLTYGLTGDTTLGDISESIFGDVNKLETAHANAIMAWTKYGPEGSGSTGVNLDNAPLGVKALWALTGGKGGWGEKHLRPEALYNEMTKSFSPTPFGVMYSPKEPREMQSAYFEYQSALKAKDFAGMNLVREKYPNFDKDLRYHDASNEEKLAMKKDPANFNMLKWWQSPYNYDNANMEMNPVDWQESFFNNGGERLTDAARIAAYHNVITDIYGGHYVAGKDRTSSVYYMGDIKLEALQKGTEKLIQQRKDWAKAIAKQVGRETGFSESQLLYRFEHPGGVDPDTGRRLGWGLWNDIIRSRGLDYNEYDINFIQQAATAEGEVRLTPFTVSDEDLSRAFQLKNMMADPNLGNRLISETPESQNIAATRAEQKQGILKATIALASDQWYFITSDQLQLVTGKPADPKINMAQEQLRVAYENWHKAKSPSQEYKDGHNAYYALQKKLLGGLKGGKALIGGLDDRLEHISHFSEPVLTTIGTGPRAREAHTAWLGYVKVRDREINSKSPNSDAIESAWEKFSAKGTAQPEEQRALEIGRVRMWHRILETAHDYRKQLTNSYSDWYEAKGNSVGTKLGGQLSGDLNSAIKQMSSVNPRFKNDIKEYFGGSSNVGGRLLDWYNY